MTYQYQIIDVRPGIRFLDAIRSGINRGDFLLKNATGIFDINENIDILADFTILKKLARRQWMIGWKDAKRGYVFLDPLPSYLAVEQYYKSIDEYFGYDRHVTFEDLKRLGYTQDNIDSHNTSHAWINGQTISVLKFDYTTIYAKEV